MTTELINGDLLDAFDKGEVDVIGHVVNCCGVMGSGIAKSIKKKYPEVFEYYIDTLSDHELFYTDPLGEVDFVSIDEHSLTPIVLNIYAQRRYGVDKRHLNYGALALAFVDIVANTSKDNKIGFPYKMGSDRAGGDWEIVLEMIEFYFKDHTVKIYKLV